MPFSRFVFLTPFTEGGRSKSPSLFKRISRNVLAPTSKPWWSLAIKGGQERMVPRSGWLLLLKMPLTVLAKPHNAFFLLLHNHHHWGPEEEMKG